MITRARSRSTLLFAALLALALLLAACGGGDDEGSGGGDVEAAVGAAGTEGKAADAFPASTVVYASVNIDRESDAWGRMVALGSRFPGWADAVADFQAELNDTSGDGTSFATDIEPWLGGELGFGVTGVTIGADGKPAPNLIAYVASTDDAKVKALLDGDSDATKTGEYKGYSVYTDSEVGPGDDQLYGAVGEGALILGSSAELVQQSIDIRAGGESLADNEAFGNALGRLPDDNLAVAYADGRQIAQLLQLAQASAPGVTAAQQAEAEEALRQLKDVTALAAALTPEDTGLRISGVTVVEPGSRTAEALGTTFETTLDENTPADALAFVSFADLGPQLIRALEQVQETQPDLEQQLAQGEALLGLSIREDIVPLLTGEHALWAAASAAGGTPTAKGALMLKPEDADAGADVIKRLLTVAQGVGGGQLPPLTDIPGGQSVEQDGQTVVWRQADDVIAIGVNDPTAGDKASPSLAEDAEYKAALEAAGVPDETLGFGYLDVPGAIGLASSMGGDDFGAEEKANAEHVGAVVWFGEKTGDDSARFDLWIGVR